MSPFMSERARLLAEAHVAYAARGWALPTGIESASLSMLEATVRLARQPQAVPAVLLGVAS